APRVQASATQLRCKRLKVGDNRRSNSNTMVPHRINSGRNEKLSTSRFVVRLSMAWDVKNMQRSHEGFFSPLPQGERGFRYRPNQARSFTKPVRLGSIQFNNSDGATPSRTASTTSGTIHSNSRKLMSV